MFMFLHGLSRQRYSGTGILLLMLDATCSCKVFPVSLSSVRPQCEVASLFCWQTGALSSICSQPSKKEMHGDEAKLISRWVLFSLFIRLTWRSVYCWKADACTEVTYSYALWITCTCVINSLEIALVLMEITSKDCRGVLVKSS